MKPNHQKILSPLGRELERGHNYERKRTPTQILKNARGLRNNQTTTEGIMWSFLRTRRFEGFKFRRQHPIGNYIVDFYCSKAKLVIEADGSGHSEKKQKEYDERRTEYLENLGLRVLRFWNNEVLENKEGVYEIILKAISRSPNPL